MGYIPPAPATREGETEPITEGWWRRWPATTEDELMGYIPPTPQSRLAETRKILRETEVGVATMTPEERSMLWAISFYVVIDALPKVASLVERIAGMFQ
jgi:hypothetical protein